MIKGQVFANQLFENQIFALFINTFTDGKDGVSDNYKNGMAITYSGSDVTIDSGAVLIQGRFLEEDTSTTISAGADNMYCKLVIEIDLDKTNTTTEFNQGYYKIVKSSTTWPTLTQTNIVKNVSGIYQYELARFRTTANGITDFEDRRTFIDFTSIYDEIRQVIEGLEDNSALVLKTGSTMTGKLIAEGGVEGNVEGNLTGNVTGNVTGNSATASKLATARKITISGAVAGNQNFDGSGNITIATTQNNIAVLTGSVTADASSYSSISYATEDITYPTGYTANNCIVLAFGLKALNDTNGYNYGGNLSRSLKLSGITPEQSVMIGSSTDMAMRGNLRTINLRNDNIRIRIVNVADQSTTFNYKIVLMKIS